MDSRLLDILCCPITLKPLHSVRGGNLDELNRLISAGELSNRGGETLAVFTCVFWHFSAYNLGKSSEQVNLTHSLPPTPSRLLDARSLGYLAQTGTVIPLHRK